ncbi:MAG: ABC transporter ATP-binding protein [Planctomycetes bacterium]|nr:ABC transporter ATP-binding protein [Planctomycetota bacterium]
MIEIKDLCGRFGTFELKHISLEVAPAEHFVLLGPSGSGKTVLTETIVGLRPCTAERLAVAGCRVGDVASKDLSVSYVPQDLAIFPHLDVRKNICFGAVARRLAKKTLEGRLKSLTHLLEIGGLIDRRSVADLSMGERQRVALARALIVAPKVLFLDEPFSALDHHIKRQLIEKLQEIKSNLDVTIFHVTHDHEEAFMLADRIAVMFNGRIAQVGSPSDVQDTPRTHEVARFLMARNMFEGVVSEANNGLAAVKVGTTTLVSRCGVGRAVGDKTIVVIRPEEVHIIRPDRPLGPKVRENIFAATVKKTIPVPGAHLVSLDIAGFTRPIETSLPNCAFEDLKLSAGKRVRASLKSESLWLMPPEDIEK